MLPTPTLILTLTLTLTLILTLNLSQRVCGLQANADRKPHAQGFERRYALGVGHAIPRRPPSALIRNRLHKWIQLRIVNVCPHFKPTTDALSSWSDVITSATILSLHCQKLTTMFSRRGSRGCTRCGACSRPRTLCSTTTPPSRLWPGRSSRSSGSAPQPTSHTLHTTHYTLHTSQYTLPSARFTLQNLHYTLHTTHFIVHISPYNLLPTPYTLHPTRYALHPTPRTLHPAAYPNSEICALTQLPEPLTLHPKRSTRPGP